MCNNVSGFVDSKLIVHRHEFVNSHTGQMVLAGYKDNKMPPAIVKYEITPPEFSKSGCPDFWDANKWNFGIDQDVLPDWATPVLIEKLAREDLQELLDSCPDTREENIPVLTGQFFAIRGTGTVGKMAGICDFVYYFPDATTIEYAGSCTIEYAGYCTIKSAGPCTIKNAGCCTIEYAGSCTIEDAGDCTIKNAGYCTIEYAGPCKIHDKEAL